MKACLLFKKNKQQRFLIQQKTPNIQSLSISQISTLIQRENININPKQTIQKQPQQFRNYPFYDKNLISIITIKLILTNKTKNQQINNLANFLTNNFKIIIKVSQLVSQNHIQNQKDQQQVNKQINNLTTQFIININFNITNLRFFFLSENSNFNLALHLYYHLNNSQNYILKSKQITQITKLTIINNYKYYENEQADQS
ncbi:hypothetical protein ABPG74_015574 [Tetrahymena malaccensis]